MKRRDRRDLVVTLASLVFCLALLSHVVFVWAIGSPFTSKSDMISQWKNLCDAHPLYASYEVIGKTVEQRDIWMFKIGNPNGGKVMYDGEGHGTEDSGTEVLYKFCKWLLESGDSTAQRILDRNYHLIVPVLNVDRSDRGNAHGVDLNRNGVYGWGQSGSSDPAAEDYRGPSAGSEPETQALRAVWDVYRPSIYVNTHHGYHSILKVDNGSLEQKVVDLYKQNSATMGSDYPYSIRVGGSGGMLAYDASKSFNVSGWTWELIRWQDLVIIQNSTQSPTVAVQTLMDEIYDDAFPMLVSFAEAAGVDSGVDFVKPQANAGQSQTVRVGDLVFFDGTGSVDDVGITSYSWSFGDGIIGSGSIATHSYWQAGTYYVSLTVEDAAGNIDTDTIVTVVHGITPSTPKPEPVHPKTTLLPQENPQITVLSPENNALHTSNTLTIAFNVSINFEKGWSYISEVTYTTSWQQDETLVYEHPSNDTHNPSSFSYDLNLTGIPEGKQSVTISAKGGGGYNDEYNYAHLFDDAYNSTSVSFTIASIYVLSPHSKTHTVSDLPLNFTVNEQWSKISYVLDGLENVTINEKTTLTNLVNGKHNLTIYATDDDGNTGASETLYFTVSVPEPFPTTLVIAVSGVSLAAVVVGLLVYLKKRKHQTISSSWLIKLLKRRR
jgi:hypothetical protein